MFLKLLNIPNFKLVKSFLYEKSGNRYFVKRLKEGKDYHYAVYLRNKDNPSIIIWACKSSKRTGEVRDHKLFVISTKSGEPVMIDAPLQVHIFNEILWAIKQYQEVTEANIIIAANKRKKENRQNQVKFDI